MTRMTFENAKAFPCPYVPYTYGAVFTAGNRAALIGAPTYAPNSTVVPFELAQAVCRFQFPKLHPPTIGSREGAFPIRTESVADSLTFVLEGNGFSLDFKRGDRTYRLCWRKTGIKESCIGLLVVFSGPV